MSNLIQVWEYNSEGRTLLGEYKELEFAMNRANNRQAEANRQHEPIWIDVGNGILQTYGSFVDTCEYCAGVGAHWQSGNDCVHCEGKGQVMVISAPDVPTQLPLL